MPSLPQTGDLDLTDRERKAALLLVRQNLSPLELETWYACTFTGRFFVRGDEQVELVTKEDGVEIDVHRFTNLELSASFKKGLVLTLKDNYGHVVEIGHVPVRLAGTETFVWIPPVRPDVRFLVGEVNIASVNVAFRAALPPQTLFGNTAYLRKA